jgi:Lrp/AsnC family leucine-responsive transcriptional regulator
MTTILRKTELDDLDLKLLARLMADGRVTWAQLASEVGLSGPSVTERVRKLERLGVLEGFTAKVSPESVGYGLLAFVAVSISGPTHQEDLLGWAESAVEVQECHVVAGAHDYLLKVRCQDSKDLERVLNRGLRLVPGVVRTNSSIVLTTAKETSAVPLPNSNGD